MNVQIVENYEELSEKACAIVAGQIIAREQPVLGLATGSTPEGMYKRLVQLFSEGKIDFAGVTVFNLDEYYGLPSGHPQSYLNYMRQNLFDHVNIMPGRVNIPPSDAPDIIEACRDYERRIGQAGGIDLQVLGIGSNGHVGFNEPDLFLKVSTHLVILSEETISANSRFFPSRENVPRQAVTMGMGSIMQAKEILLLASGHHKSRALKEACSGRVTTSLPASLLQLHRNVTVIADRDAAAEITG